MFDEAIAQRFAGLKVEHGRALYRYYTLTRQLETLTDQLEGLIEDLARMEAGLVELDHVKRDWVAQKAIDEAAATEGE